MTRIFLDWLGTLELTVHHCGTCLVKDLDVRDIHPHHLHLFFPDARVRRMFPEAGKSRHKVPEKNGSLSVTMSGRNRSPILMEAAVRYTPPRFNGHDRSVRLQFLWSKTGPFRRVWHISFVWFEAVKPPVSLDMLVEVLFVISLQLRFLTHMKLLCACPMLTQVRAYQEHLHQQIVCCHNLLNNMLFSTWSYAFTTLVTTQFQMRKDVKIFTKGVQDEQISQSF